MNNPKITVYIPSHNYGKYLGEAIESVLRQTMDDWELIVIDDNSTDNTNEVMQLYKGHPKISLCKTEGIGLPSVCNFALNKANGEYIVRLDGDDVFDENILLVLGHNLDNNPDVALIFPDYYLVDAYGEVFAHERIRKLYSNNHMLDMPPNGACTMIRRNIIEEIGGYREDLGVQDGFDLWSKVKNNYKSLNVNIPLFYYRRHTENLTGNITRILSARRQIKKDIIKEKIENHRPIIAVIPCRRHFDFVEDLWKQKINGESLLERDIKVCLDSSMFDYIIVACDNPEANEIVSKINNPRLKFFQRDTKSTLRTTSITPTLEKIAKEVDPELLGTTVIRYIQTPFVTIDTLEEAVTTLAMTDATSAYAVEEIHSPLFKKTPHGLETINQKGELTSDFDTVYRDAMTCIAISNNNLQTGSLSGSSIASFVVSPAECFFINSTSDLKTAQLIAEENS